MNKLYKYYVKDNYLNLKIGKFVLYDCDDGEFCFREILAYSRSTYSDKQDNNGDYIYIKLKDGYTSPFFFFDKEFAEKFEGYLPYINACTEMPEESVISILTFEQ